MELPLLAAVGAHDADEREDLPRHAVGLGQGVLSWWVCCARWSIPWVSRARRAPFHPSRPTRSTSPPIHKHRNPRPSVIQCTYLAAAPHAADELPVERGERADEEDAEDGDEGQVAVDAEQEDAPTDQLGGVRACVWGVVVVGEVLSRIAGAGGANSGSTII